MSYDKKYNGYQVAKKAGAEDADSRRTDQAGQITQKSQYCPSCRTCHLFTSYGFTYRERCTEVSRIEKGVPTVAIGIYLRVLYALQLDDDILLLAKEDTMGKALQDLSLKKRERASKKE